jgi:Ankyrin repeats (many copies)
LTATRLWATFPAVGAARRLRPSGYRKRIAAFHSPPFTAVCPNERVSNDTAQRGLQNAVAGGSIDVVKLLVAHGADIDRPTTKIGGGAMGFAAHFDRREIAAYLPPLSRDVHNLTYLGFRDRLAELFAADPGLVNARRPLRLHAAVRAAR